MNRSVSADLRWQFVRSRPGLVGSVFAYGRTRQEVRGKLDKARERLNAGAPVRDAKQSVGDWLGHWRATTLAVSDRKE